MTDTLRRTPAAAGMSGGEKIHLVTSLNLTNNSHIYIMGIKDMWRVLTTLQSKIDRKNSSLTEIEIRELIAYRTAGWSAFNSGFSKNVIWSVAPKDVAIILKSKMNRNYQLFLVCYPFILAILIGFGPSIINVTSGEILTEFRGNVREVIAFVLIIYIATLWGCLAMFKIQHEKMRKIIEKRLDDEQR